MKKTIITNKVNPTSSGSIRIIGGRYRGKKLSFPAMAGLRPTTDRVRETLFNWLMHDIQGARCLDAFAGSGALGFEAHSRGAAHVTFIESMPAVYLNLKQLAASFQSTTLTVVHADATAYLRQQIAIAQPSYDIIFIDPPFASPQLLDCIHAFETSTLLANDGLLYLETPADITLNPLFWQKIKSKKAGQVTYALYQKKTP